MSSEVLERRLWAVVLYATAPLPISSPCECRFKYLIQDGIEHLKLQDHLASDTHIRVTEANLGSFAARVLLEATDQCAHEIQETDFDRVRKRMCPVFPLC